MEKPDMMIAERQWNYCPWCGRTDCEGMDIVWPRHMACPAYTEREKLRMVPKDQLEHGAYYHGSCRNASIARWNAEAKLFVHWRTKFGIVFPETIGYWKGAKPEEQRFDEFKPFGKVTNPPFEIPLTEEEFEACGGYVWELP